MRFISQLKRAGPKALAVTQGPGQGPGLRTGALSGDSGMSLGSKSIRYAVHSVGFGLFTGATGPEPESVW